MQKQSGENLLNMILENPRFQNLVYLIMYEINQYREYAELSIVLTRKD